MSDKPQGASASEMFAEKKPAEADPASPAAASGAPNEAERTFTRSPADAPSELSEAESIKQLIASAAKERRPIIVLFGFSYAGKTALAIRLQNIYGRAGRRHGGNPEQIQYTIVPEIDTMGAKDRTDRIRAHSFNGPRPQDSFILVDLPGERFFRAMENKFTTSISEAMLSLISSADGYVILLEADKAIYRNEMPDLTELDRTQFQRLLASIASFTALDWHLERKARELGSPEAAIEWIRKPENQLALNQQEYRSRGSNKPLFLGLSIADRLERGIRELEIAYGKRTRPNRLEAEIAATADAMKENYDLDPLLYLHTRHPDMYRQIVGPFRKFRIDFVTSFAGLPDSFDKDLDMDRCNDYPAYGVEQNFEWLRLAARKSKRSWARRLLPRRLWWALRALPSTGDTKWALRARRKWDKEFVLVR